MKARIVMMAPEEHDDIVRFTLTRAEAVELINDLYFAAELADYPGGDPCPLHARDYRKYAQVLVDAL